MGKMNLKIDFIVAFCFQSVLSFNFDDVATIVDITQHTVSTLLKVPELVDVAGYEKNQGVDLPFMKKHRQLSPIIKKFAEVTLIVQKIDRDLKASNLQTMATLEKKIPLQYRYQMKLDSVEDTITLIDLYHQNFLSYIDLAQEKVLEVNHVISSKKSKDSIPNPNMKFDRYTLENFANSLIAHVPTSVRGLMDRIHEMIVPSSNDPVRKFLRDGLFKTMLNTFDELESSMCNTEMSPQQLIYNLYSTLQVTQLKAFVMMQFAYHLLHIYNKGDFSHETAFILELFKTRLMQQLVTAKFAMSQADNVVYKCDPRTYIEGQTFTQLTMLLQGYIVNEVDLNGKESCTDNCATYTYSKQYGCFGNQFCARQKPCDGNLVKCKFYDADMTVCPSSSNSNVTRRYEWIEYENGITLGKKSHCRNFEDKVDSWWRFVFHCSYCICLCDARDNPNSHRYWSLRPVESHIADNKVIVGLRFVKQNRVIHLQILQASLLPELLINSTSAEWLPVNHMEVQNPKVIEGLDYHKMNFEKRALDLDDLRVDSGYVLTGVRFRVLGNHLNLEIRETPFDYKTGQLKQRKSQWIGNDNTDANINDPRQHLSLENKDISIASATASVPDSTHDSYLLFTNSDLNRDVAQSTVPFIDIQPVTTDPLTPLAGAGIYHKSAPGFGGFVAPKVFTVNVLDYLSPGFLEQE